LLLSAATACSYPDYAFVPAGSCRDRITNGLETDTDCGGPACSGCSDGRPCRQGRDCASTVYRKGVPVWGVPP